MEEMEWLCSALLGVLAANKLGSVSGLLLKSP
jgi:hypothetical protein